MASFGEADDLAAIGVPVAGQIDRAEKLLKYASAIIRSTFPDIDERIADQTLDVDLATFVAVSMVKRAWSSPADEATSATDVAGMYSHVRSYTNGTGLYLSSRELKLLRPGGAKRKAFTVNPMQESDDKGVADLPYWSAQDGRWA